MAIQTSRGRWASRLGRWIKRRGAATVARDVAVVLGRPLSRQAIYHYVAGTRLPSHETMRALQQVSGGAVRPSDFSRRVESALEPAGG